MVARVRGAAAAIAGRARLLSERFTGWAVLLGTAAFLEARIMLPGPVGMADNSDGRRLICQLGAAPVTGWHDSSYWWHTQLAYIPDSSPCVQAYQSSQLLLLRAAEALTGLFFSDRVLDLRVLGLLTVLALAGAVWLIHYAAPGSRRLRLLFAAGLVAILADSAFADFIMTPYSEPSVMIGFLYTVGGALLMRGRGRSGWYGLAVFLAGSAYMLCAKTQTLTMLAPLVLALLLFRIPGDERRGRWGRLGVRAAVLAALGVVVLAFPPQATPGGLSAQTRFNLVFIDILPMDGHPAADLKSLGYPAGDVKFEGDNAWCAELLNPDDPAAVAAQNVATYPGLAGFLLGHPLTALKILQKAAVHGFFQPQATASFCDWPDHRLGDYPADASAATRYDERFIPVSLVLKQARHGALPLLLAGWGAMTWIGIRVRRRDQVRREWAGLLLFLTAAGAVQFATAAFGDGIDLTKHLNLSVLATAMAAVVAGYLAVTVWRDHRSAGAAGPAESASTAEPCVTAEPSPEPSPASDPVPGRAAVSAPAGESDLPLTAGAG